VCSFSLQKFHLLLTMYRRHATVRAIKECFDGSSISTAANANDFHSADVTAMATTSYRKRIAWQRVQTVIALAVKCFVKSWLACTETKK
jgi:hypothetical protein